ncbi:glycoside hydrolase family 3 C-terminal domain-containing protein [Streptomyces fulvoviolaceus]|uniref:glycoside hydrolase family 3 C-terminal domain-containing protein n=1 Tax=Streptomyces fulvoviolaceus TaxID=285535 RepID=UPI00069497EC|nr:glycoside hydrolase family 3 C-terminal domain-containing protein [Streptomyces fulvoviolaceus]
MRPHARPLRTARPPRTRRTLATGLCCLSLLGTAVATAPADTALTAAAGESTPPLYLDTRHSFEERAADLVSRMTLSEKAQQLHTNSAPAIGRLGVQQYTYWNEGQHGVNRLGANVNDGPASGGVHATSFPTNFAAAMTWDRDLMYRASTAISDEIRGFLDKSLWGTGQNNLGTSKDNYGSLTFWAPTVNMDRDPRWGRTDEAFGEDPYMVAELAGAYVNGYQDQTADGKPRSKYLKVAATAKHYALNNVEQDRMGVSSDTTDNDLHDYYTAQFKSLIEKYRVSGLMTSYNAINGTPSAANTYTTNQIAGRSYGFAGYVTSDCDAVGTTYQSFPQGHDWAPPGWTTDGKGAQATWTNSETGQRVSGAAGGQAYALRSGTHINCTGQEATAPNLREAIEAGVLSEGVIDSALVHLFTVRMRTGEFDAPEKVPYTGIGKDVIESQDHRELARKVADNALVLLQNDKVSGTDEPLLPVNPAQLNKVVIVGDLADKVTLGGYSGDPSVKVSAVAGITAQAKAANPDVEIVYDAAGTSTTATGAAVLAEQTRAGIKDADLVVVAVGTDAAVADEGQDHADLEMPGNYGSLIDQVTDLGNPRTVLSIQSSRPMELEGVRERVPAVLFSGYNGQSQGDALADVLFGRHNPSGRLNFTWYKDDSQLPDISDYGLSADDTGGLGRTYQYFTGTPTYPFGHGLSYTDFAYTNIKADRRSVSADGSVNVGVDVTNTGAVPGSTVAQLYAATLFEADGRELPKKRLAGFQKTRVLAPGQTQHVTLRVKVPDLAFWDGEAARQVVHNGRYRFEVGPDASTVSGSATVGVHGKLSPRVRHVTVQPEAVAYDVGDTIDLTGRNHWIKDDTDPARQPGRNLDVKADHVVEAVNNDGSFVDVKNLGKARVSYRSSDPSVATVSRDGLVTAVGNGVATISAAVDGVTGSAVITVHHPLTLDTDRMIRPGQTTTVKATYANGGSTAVRDAAVELTTPDGWTAEAITPTRFARIAPGTTASVTWKVTVPANGSPGPYDLSVRAAYRGARTDDNTRLRVSVPYATLSDARNNTAVSDDTQTALADIDGAGRSLSAQALAEQGITSGGTVTYDGVTFTWPTTGGGARDDIAAGGQTVPLTGSGTKLGFLGTATNGLASDVATVTYTDGTTQEFTLSFADWWDNKPAKGGGLIASPAYLNTQNGRTVRKVGVYGSTVTLREGRTPAYVTLPAISTEVGAGQNTMHIFAIALN